MRCDKCGKTTTETEYDPNDGFICKQCNKEKLRKRQEKLKQFYKYPKPRNEKTVWIK